MVLSLASPCIAQDVALDDDEDFRPGLVARIDGANQPVSSIVAEPVLTGDTRTSVTAPRRGTWSGRFLSRAEGRHRFHAHLTGRATVTFDGRVVLSAESDQPGWVSGPEFELGFGDFSFEVTAEVTAPSATFRLFWSSDAFPLEPVPYHALFHDVDSQTLRQTTAGLDLLRAWQCGQCHSGLPTDDTLAGPSLATFSSGTNLDWLRERLTRTEPAPHGRMPAFGFSGEDADAILAFLQASGKQVEHAKVTLKASEKDLAAGRQLLKSVGCLGCHGWESLGKNPLLGGGALEAVAQHRSVEWLQAQLTDPQALNRHSRMPVFTLSETERKQILLALTTPTAKSDSQNTAAKPKSLTKSATQIARGQELVRTSRCQACHELPGEKGERTAIQKLAAITASQLGNGRDCLSAISNQQPQRPRFAQTAQTALATAMQDPAALAVDLTRDPVALGAWRLQTKGCVQCHDRNGSQGLAAITKQIVATEANWTGQAPTLQPPSLTAVGDRLPDATLEKGVQGALPSRMNWLRVRMPRFRHTAEEIASLTSLFRQHDRIPDAAPDTPQYPVSPAGAQVDPQIMLAGRELTGGKGFSCVACHQLKDYVPPKVALGTRGSDLYRLGERMRAPYFFRWTRAPLRILPGVEMPSYQRPHPTLLAGDLPGQLAAIWDALHDPQFTAPTNPAVVEQLWGPSESGRPRILRDVVTLPLADGKTESVPRTFAVGFANRHSVLFDLDRGQVRSWTLGDFARQRTQGKSWFWDMAGAALASAVPERPDLLLHSVQSRDKPATTARTSPVAILRDYEIRPDHSVRWSYWLSSQDSSPDGGKCPIVTEHWQAAPDGWTRRIEASHLPSDSEVWLRRPAFQQILGQPRIAPTGGTWQRLPSGDGEGVLLRTAESGGAVVVIEYHSELAVPAGILPAAPEPVLSPEAVTCLPGFEGQRLPLPRTIMPTALTWDRDKSLLLTSLKGHVYRAAPSSQSATLPDRLQLMAEGLAAPYGIFALDDQILVSHKPEVLALADRDGDGFAERQKVVASGWGFTDDYHDWTCGIVRDSQQKFYIGLGSDYSHKNRPLTESRWRGHILQFDLQGHVEPVATGLRYATGLALLPGDRLFCSDQQGVQNCFNELNYIRPGRRYGVPAQLDPKEDNVPAEVAAIQIPHPWTRSVNGIAVWPPESGHPFAGQLVGVEYNERVLIRASVDEVDGVLQGAVYPMSRRVESTGPETLLGPLSVAFGPDGALYVGSIHDSGWLGGLNTGDIVRFQAQEQLPNGIRQVRATANGFAIDFLQPIDGGKAVDPAAYQVSGYTRKWEGNYATPDSGRHVPTITKVDVSSDRRTVRLTIPGLKIGHVYDLAVGDIVDGNRDTGGSLWPAVAYYTLHRQPAAKP